MLLAYSNGLVIVGFLLVAASMITMITAFVRRICFQPGYEPDWAMQLIQKKQRADVLCDWLERYEHFQNSEEPIEEEAYAAVLAEYVTLSNEIRHTELYIEDE